MSQLKTRGLLFLPLSCCRGGRRAGALGFAFLRSGRAKSSVTPTCRQKSLRAVQISVLLPHVPWEGESRCREVCLGHPFDVATLVLWSEPNVLALQGCKGCCTRTTLGGAVSSSFPCRNFMLGFSFMDCLVRDR